ncbi:MAG: hypothetical protein Kow0090_22840 [Myxococcota bacterium]
MRETELKFCPHCGNSLAAPPLEVELAETDENNIVEDDEQNSAGSESDFTFSGPAPTPDSSSPEEFPIPKEPESGFELDDSPAPLKPPIPASPLRPPLSPLLSRDERGAQIVDDAEIIGDLEETDHLGEPSSERPSTDTSLPVVPTTGRHFHSKPQRSQWTIVWVVGLIAFVAASGAFLYLRFATDDKNITEAQSHYAYGNQMMAMNNYDEAIKHYSLAIEHNKNFAEAYLALGAAYASMREEEKALTAYQKFLNLAPNHPEAKKVSEILKTKGGASKKKTK